MHIDENEFFRGATLRICSSLEIEKALHSCFLFLQEFMPLDRIYLQCGDCDTNTIRTIATATPTEYIALDEVTHLPPDIVDCEHKDLPERYGVYMFEGPESSPISREMLKFHQVPCTAHMVLPLISGEEIVGHLVCLTEREQKFSDEHARLISLLKEPFTIALSNTLKHRSELKLYDRNFFWEATMRICGSLDIEEAMFSTLQFLQKDLPADRMALEYYDEALDSMRTIAIADSTGGKSVDLVTPLSAEAKELAARKYYGDHPKFYLFENPKTDKLAQEMLDFHGVDATSLVVLVLESGGEKLGTLVLVSEGDKVFSQKHADLLSLLSKPFAIALSNTLKHRSELKLYDRDFFWGATQRICGSLKIEEALWQCLLFLQKYMPVEEAALTYFDPKSDTITLNTHADSSGGRHVNLKVPYPEEAKPTLSDPTVMEDLLDNKADKNPLASSILKAMKRGKSSLLITRLIVEGEWVGSVVLWASGWDRFNEEHLRLLKQLKQPFFIALSNSRHYNEILELKDLLADDNQYLQEELQRIRGDEIIGSDFGLKDVMDKVRSVASHSSPVLLLGETGVGKEVIAAAIHNASPRRDEPFIKVNCGAIPESLMDSELFGHEKGAFTGALSQKRGRFERAHKGTIFLDEIGELSLEAQVRLLRVLQEKEIERVGGTETIKVDIRVIAATHRNLEDMILDGSFREDLYFRLQVFPVKIPTLRERKGDIPSLVQHFIQKKSRELKLASIPALAPGAHDQLLAYTWPGNVRELENVIERAIILNRDEALSFRDLGQQGDSEGHSLPITEQTMAYNLDQIVSDHIQKVLKETKGRVEGNGGAAELLGVNPGTLRHRMRKLGVSFGRNNH